MILLEEAVIIKLKNTQTLLCTIESCTGGLIAHLITNVPGASEVYWGSLVTYDNSAKEELGISSDLITTQGAVSPEVAQAMAEKGLERMENNPFRWNSHSLLKPKALICLATTGIAGPSGGSLSKPVGLCFIGLALSGQKTLIKKVLVSESLTRIQMKTQFAHQALEFIKQVSIE